MNGWLDITNMMNRRSIQLSVSPGVMHRVRQYLLQNLYTILPLRGPSAARPFHHSRASRTQDDKMQMKNTVFSNMGRRGGLHDGQEMLQKPFDGTWFLC